MFSGISDSRDQSDHLVELNKESAQTLSGLRIVHVFNQRAHILKNIGRTLKDIAAASLRLHKWTQLVMPVNEVIAVVLVGTSTILGLVLLDGKDFQVFPVLLTQEKKSNNRSSH